MRGRWLGLAALAAVAAGGLAGCGEATSTADDEAVGGELTIYSSLPLQGPLAPISQQLVGGEKIALAAADARVGHFKIAYISRDDSNTTNGLWSPGEAANNAKVAAEDTSTIAYIGDYDSGATAISLPLINGAGIPQVSPSSPYVGLTSSVDAGQDEPERFYPSGHRTFVRLAPGDLQQAAAQARLMRELGVRRLYILDEVEDQEEPFELSLADLVATDATQAGIEVVGHDHLSVTAHANWKAESEKIAESHAQAVFFAGAGSEAAASLWVALHEADPHLLLLGASALAEEDTFVPAIGAAAASTYLITPALPPRMYPPPARRVLARYGRLFGGEASAYVLYGYEAMGLVLSAIRKAGRQANDRAVVTARLLSTYDRRSVLGRYSVQPDGETTLSRFAVDRVSGGRLVFYKLIEP